MPPLQVLCRVAESGDVRLQRPAAAGLANLAVDDGLLQPLPPAFLPSLLSLCNCPDQDVQVSSRYVGLPRLRYN